MIEMAEAIIAANRRVEDADAAAKIALFMREEAEKEIEELNSIIKFIDEFVNNLQQPRKQTSFDEFSKLLNI